MRAPHGRIARPKLTDHTYLSSFYIFFPSLYFLLAQSACPHPSSNVITSRPPHFFTLFYLLLLPFNNEFCRFSPLLFFSDQIFSSLFRPLFSSLALFCSSLPFFSFFVYSSSLYLCFIFIFSSPKCIHPYLRPFFFPSRVNFLYRSFYLSSPFSFKGTGSPDEYLVKEAY